MTTADDHDMAAIIDGRHVESSMTESPVVVIGAGPQGLAAAAHLLQRGLEPLVIDVMHSRDLRVLHDTNTPMGGLAGAPADAEAKRRAVNAWIRTQSLRTESSTSTRRCATWPTRRALPHTSTVQITCTSTSPGTWRSASQAHSSCSSIPRARETRCRTGDVIARRTGPTRGVPTRHFPFQITRRFQRGVFAVSRSYVSRFS